MSNGDWQIPTGDSPEEDLDRKVHMTRAADDTIARLHTAEVVALMLTLTEATCALRDHLTTTGMPEANANCSVISAVAGILLEPEFEADGEVVE